MKLWPGFMTGKKNRGLQTRGKDASIESRTETGLWPGMIGPTIPSSCGLNDNSPSRKLISESALSKP